MDYDPKHTAKVVSKCLKNNKVHGLKWPSQSLNIWAGLKMCVRARQPNVADRVIKGHFDFQAGFEGLV